MLLQLLATGPYCCYHCKMRCENEHLSAMNRSQLASVPFFLTLLHLFLPMPFSQQFLSTKEPAIFCLQCGRQGLLNRSLQPETLMICERYSLPTLEKMLDSAAARLPSGYRLPEQEIHAVLSS